MAYLRRNWIYGMKKKTIYRKLDNITLNKIYSKRMQNEIN